MPKWSAHYALAPFSGVSQHNPPPATKIEADSPTLRTNYLALPSYTPHCCLMLIPSHFESESLRVMSLESYLLPPQGTSYIDSSPTCNTQTLGPWASSYNLPWYSTICAGAATHTYMSLPSNSRVSRFQTISYKRIKGPSYLACNLPGNLYLSSTFHPSSRSKCESYPYATTLDPSNVLSLYANLSHTNSVAVSHQIHALAKSSWYYYYIYLGSSTSPTYPASKSILVLR